MKLIFRTAMVFTALMALTFSCADKQSEDPKEQQQRSLDTWISLHVNKNGQKVAEKLESGMYIQWLEGPHTDQARPMASDMIEINYTAMRLTDFDPETGTGSVIMHRSEETARKEGSFSYYTHYVPQKFEWSRLVYVMDGQYDALERMYKGDKVRLYLPTWTASYYYGLTYSNGFEGQLLNSGRYTIASLLSQPIVMDLELVDITPDPKTAEEEMVRDYALNEWGREETDTVRAYAYYEITHYENGDTVRTDSTSYLYYVKKFLIDDFIIETNIDSINRRINRTGESSTARTYRPASHQEEYEEALYDIFNAGKVTYGSHFKMVFTSQYGYGALGNGSDGNQEPYTIIQMYDPLVYEVYVEPYDNGDDD